MEPSHIAAWIIFFELLVISGMRDSNTRELARQTLCGESIPIPRKLN